MLLTLRGARTFIRESSGRNFTLACVRDDSAPMRICWHNFIHHFEGEADCAGWNFRNDENWRACAARLISLPRKFDRHSERIGWSSCKRSSACNGENEHSRRHLTLPPGCAPGPSDRYFAWLPTV